MPFSHIIHERGAFNINDPHRLSKHAFPSEFLRGLTLSDCKG